MLALGVTGVLQSVFMSLGDDLLAPVEPESTPCQFARFVEASEFREQLEIAIGRIIDQRAQVGNKVTSGYTSVWLIEILRKNGINDFSPEQVQRHVRGACSCARHLALVADESR